MDASPLPLPPPPSQRITFSCTRNEEGEATACIGERELRAESAFLRTNTT